MNTNRKRFNRIAGAERRQTIAHSVSCGKNGVNISSIFRELDATALLINGPTDHVHILAVLPAKLAPAEILNKVKTNSSGWVHKDFPKLREFAWQTGYGAFGVSPSQKQTVLDYISDQEEHHRKVSFKEEFVAFLKKHEIQYDERYLWE